MATVRGDKPMGCRQVVIRVTKGVVHKFLPFRYFPNFFQHCHNTLAFEYHVHIWQVSPQLSCGNIRQIWMWFKESKRYFCEIRYFRKGEISEWSFSNPHPRTNLSCTWFEIACRAVNVTPDISGSPLISMGLPEISRVTWQVCLCIFNEAYSRTTCHAVATNTDTMHGAM